MSRWSDDRKCWVVAQAGKAVRGPTEIRCASLLVFQRMQDARWRSRHHLPSSSLRWACMLRKSGVRKEGICPLHCGGSGGRRTRGRRLRDREYGKMILQSTTMLLVRCVGEKGGTGKDPDRIRTAERAKSRVPKEEQSAWQRSVFCDASRRSLNGLRFTSATFNRRPRSGKVATKGSSQVLHRVLDGCHVVYRFCRRSPPRCCTASLLCLPSLTASCFLGNMTAPSMRE